MILTTDKSKAEEADAIRKALLVLVTTSETRVFLAGRDPKALQQAEAALRGSPELEAFWVRERERADERKPKFCPFCGGGVLRTDVVNDGWPAYSSEDPGNKAVLLEHQCTDCDGKSFWT